MDATSTRLRSAGCVWADEEARALHAHAVGPALEDLIRRRMSGQLLEHLLGEVTFSGLRLSITPGVYVPRPRSADLARAVGRYAPSGVAVDVCCGCGALARLLADLRPDLEVLATDLDATAVASARANGVAAIVADLLDAPQVRAAAPLAAVLAVAPYVPEGDLAALDRDTLAHIPRTALDGGDDGLHIVRRLVRQARELLVTGGVLGLELGGEQLTALLPDLGDFQVIEHLVDVDGSNRGAVAIRV